MEIVLGLDEVGRGPLAGPLVIGAVILGHDFQSLPAYTELKDSKLLSPGKRQALAQTIRDHAQATGLGWVSSYEIDQYGLSSALCLAARRATQQALISIPTPHQIIIDGTVNFLIGTEYATRVTTLKKADNLVKEVSAASIIAKVARDYYMTRLAEKYPEYGFAHHMGYGTAAHLAALRQYGPCPEHRQSFRPVATCQTTAHTPTSPQDITPPLTTTARGHIAESATLAYLAAQGHQLIAQNFRTRSAEIDLITRKEQAIYFTEVKYRQNSHHGSALDQITPAKLRQMRYASEIFLAKNPQFSSLSPLLAAASVSGSAYTVDDWLVIV